MSVGFDAAGEISVEDAIDDGPIVDRFAVGVFAVGAGRAPFEGWSAIAGAEEVVGAEVDLGGRRLGIRGWGLGAGDWKGGAGAELAEFGDELLAVFHVGVVRLVGAEETPDGF